MDAAQLARHLGLTRAWVYQHADELGAVRIGNGPRARLRFDLPTATAALGSRGGDRNAQPEGSLSSAGARRRPRRQPLETVPLLPVNPPRTRGLLARVWPPRRTRG
jgi:hypothetical protein